MTLKAHKKGTRGSKLKGNSSNFKLVHLLSKYQNSKHFGTFFQPQNVKKGPNFFVGHPVFINFEFDVMVQYNNNNNNNNIVYFKWLALKNSKAFRQLRNCFHEGPL